MNQDQRRALAQLRTMYPQALHAILESEFRIFVQDEEASKYKNPTDLVSGYLKWLQETEK